MTDSDKEGAQENGKQDSRKDQDGNWKLPADDHGHTYPTPEDH